MTAVEVNNIRRRGVFEKEKPESVETAERLEQLAAYNVKRLRVEALLKGYINIGTARWLRELPTDKSFLILENLFLANRLKELDGLAMSNHSMSPRFFRAVKEV